MKHILVDVDTQFDFVDPKGALHAPAPQSVKDCIKHLLMEAMVDGIGDDYEAIIGSVDSHAYDAWEFKENGGPFPAHCVKGQPGWMRVYPDFPAKQRFVSMTPHRPGPSPYVLVGEKHPGEGVRPLTPHDLAAEAIDGKVGLYFEKEVYSLFSNPFASLAVEAIVERLGGPSEVIFDVIGYCTGQTADGNFFCVGSAAAELAQKGYKVRILANATAPLMNLDPFMEAITKLGVEWVE